MTAYDDPRTMAPLPVTTRPATGRQYVLQRGGAVARIGSVAAVLKEFSVDGTRYTETWPVGAPPPMAAGIVLVPWPNRVAGASWMWDGAQQHLDISDRARGHAIHGLARFTDYAEVECSADSVTLATTIYPQHGWPFTLATSVTYALGPAAGSRESGWRTGPGLAGSETVGLTVTHRVENIGPGRAVFGCGAHPYLRIGEVPVDELTLAVRAGRVLVTDERLIPTGSRTLDGALAGLPAGVGLDTLTLDTGFTDLRPADSGRYEHVLTAPDGRRLTLWADADFRYVVVFTPDAFPDDPSRGGSEAARGVIRGAQGPDEAGKGVMPGVHRAVAIEPMTCPTNALNSGDGLIELEPGATWSACWGLTPGANFS